jgi:hypothetical protein
VPAAIPIITAIIGAAGVGTSIYSLTNQPGAPKPTAPPAPTLEEANKTKQNQMASLSQAFPGIQAATGGSLSPEAWIRLSELISGKSGEPGIGAAGEDLLKLLKGGGGSTVSVGGGGAGGSTGSSGLTPPGGSYG